MADGSVVLPLPLSSCLGLFLEENTYDEYENDLGITAVALYDYQAGEMPTCPLALVSTATPLVGV